MVTRRAGIFSPAWWHPPVARTRNFLVNGPMSWRPASIPVAAYMRKLSGIPLTGGQGTVVVSGSGLATISVGPQGLGNVWYPAQVTISTTSGVNDTSTCQVFLGPAGVPVTLLGTIFPGGIGTLGAAVPPLAPGQQLIAQWTGGKSGDVAAINVVGTMDSVMPG